MMMTPYLNYQSDKFCIALFFLSLTSLISVALLLGAALYLFHLAHQLFISCAPKWRKHRPRRRRTSRQRQGMMADAERKNTIYYNTSLYGSRVSCKRIHLILLCLSLQTCRVLTAALERHGVRRHNISFDSSLHLIFTRDSRTRDSKEREAAQTGWMRPGRRPIHPHVHLGRLHSAEREQASFTMLYRSLLIIADLFTPYPPSAAFFYYYFTRLACFRVHSTRVSILLLPSLLINS